MPTGSERYARFTLSFPMSLEKIRRVMTRTVGRYRLSSRFCSDTEAMLHTFYSTGYILPPVCVYQTTERTIFLVQRGEDGEVFNTFRLYLYLNTGVLSSVEYLPERLPKRRENRVKTFFKKMLTRETG